MDKTNHLIATLVLLTMAVPGLAHDAWVQTTQPSVAVDEVIQVDLMMGNHGNNHRDFLVVGKVDPGDSTVELVTPGGRMVDLKPLAVDTAPGQKEGFWTVPLRPLEAGVHMVRLTSDKVVHYAPKRSIKTAKAYIAVTGEPRGAGVATDLYTLPINRGLELVPTTDPLRVTAGGSSVELRLLLHGKPLAGQVVSFIPHGETLHDEFDERFERVTDADGRVSYPCTTAKLHLVAAHFEEKSDGRDEKYNAIKYSATLTLHVRAP